MATSASIAPHIAGCGDPAEQAFDETGAVIFPDDPAPSESCDLGVPLSCGMTTWSVEHTSDFVTQARRTLTFNRSNTASISGGSSGGTHMICTSTGDIVLRNIYAGGAVVPRDGFKVREDNKGIQFNPRLLPTHTIPPVRSRDAETICNLWCSADGTQVGCGLRSGNTDRWKGRLTGAGVDRAVTLVGEYDRHEYDPVDQILKVYCKLTLPKSQLMTSRRRPNDVISTNGSRFVRGYELTGTALRSACNALAQKTCVPPDPRNPGDIVGLCINPRTETCVSSFRDNPDPCRPVCQQTCTSTAQCGSHAICSGGCCRANPH